MSDDALTASSPLPDWMTRRGAAADGPVELTRADEATLTLFLALATQWHRCPVTGVRNGLNYAAIAPTAALLPIAVDGDRFGDIQAMEQAALAEWARRTKS